MAKIRAIQIDTGTGANQVVELDVTSKLPAVDGSNVTSVDAGSLDGQLGSFYTNASNLDAGSVPDARVSQTSVTQHEAALSIGGGQVTGSVANATNAADAALLDSIDSASFLRSDAADAKSSGTLTFNDDIILAIGTGDDAEFHWDGTDMFTDINGGGNWFFRDGNSANAVRFTFDIDTGELTATGDLTAFSDSRVKTDLEPIGNALDKVMTLTGYTFKRTDIEDDSRHAGVIAQEVQAVLPEVVHENEGGMLSVAYGNIVGLLINAIKEQQEQIDALKTKVEELRK